MISVLMSHMSHTQTQHTRPGDLQTEQRALGPDSEVPGRLVSVQKWPFCDSALWYLQLDSLETNFCCSATTASQFLLCNREISATLLLQWQNVSQLRNILLFCYSATPVAECFALAKYYVILLLYSQNNNSRVFHQVPIKLCHYRCLYSL